MVVNASSRVGVGFETDLRWPTAGALLRNIVRGSVSATVYQPAERVNMEPACAGRRWSNPHQDLDRLNHMQLMDSPQ